MQLSSIEISLQYLMVMMKMTVEDVAAAVVVGSSVGVTQLQSSKQYNIPNIQRLQWQLYQY